VLRAEEESSVIRYALLGLVQGLTEFLPISSSAHLILAQRFLGVDPPGVLLEALLHLGTLAAVVLAFRRDLLHLARSAAGRGSLAGRKEIGMILAGTIPILIAGFLLRDVIDDLFSSLWLVGVALIATGGVLLAADRLARRSRRSEVRFLDALIIGIAQAFALLPGLSRSGVTIASGITMGLSAPKAARFSFLLAVPALSGAGIVTLWDAVRVAGLADQNVAGLLVGALVSFAVGLAAIRVLLALIAKGRLWFFAVYCLAVGISICAWVAA